MNRIVRAVVASAFLFSAPPVLAQVIGDTPIGHPGPGTAALPITAPASQTTISTTGPVSSSTKIDVGTYAGQALMWVATVFGGAVGTALTALLMRLLKNAGIAGSDLLRQRVQEFVVNGLNAAAGTAADRLKGKGEIEVKNEIVANTVKYVQAHGADTLKQLGIDPNSNIAVEAIKARIETAITDPSTPTPAIIGPAPLVVAKT